MSVRGTENYVYFVDNILKLESTAVVYFGRQKKRGDIYTLLKYFQMEKVQ